MPNHVINQVQSENLTALLQLRDFNRIIPMPITLEVDSGSASYLYEQLNNQGLTLDEIIQEMTTKVAAPASLKRLVRRYRINEKLYGYLDWYHWRLDHWDTKWSAYEYELDHEISCCRFWTAWTHPEIVIETLSRQYPDDVFRVTFAEEQIGFIAGQYEVQNGFIFGEVYFEEYSRAAFETAFSLWGGDHYYKLDEDNDTYIYIGDQLNP